MTEHDRELLDKLADEAKHAEEASDAEPHHQRRRSSAQAVYGLRLPTQRIEQLHKVAAARGIEPSVLARNWVIEQLDRAENDDPGQQRWERDLRATTGHLRELLDQRPGA